MATARAVRCSLALLSTLAPAARAQCIVERAEVLLDDASFSDNLGVYLALEGTTLVLGLPEDDDLGGGSGSVRVYSAVGDAWTPEATLLAPDGIAGDHFGAGVAISGDTIAIGAFEADAPQNASGAVYVFVKVGGTWGLQDKLVASDATNADHLGASVALDGDTLVAGAPLAGTIGPPGAAYVFVRSGTTWSEQTKITASDGASGDVFGEWVALDGETCLVGAPGDDDAGDGSGSAYVFVRSGIAWSEQAKLTASDAGAGDDFGLSVALEGDIALVGAPQDDHAGFLSGSAYVFERSGTTWMERARLSPQAGDELDIFGRSVALSGDRAVIGAPGNGVPASRPGSAHVFTRSGSTWSETVELLASDGQTSDAFGVGVVLAGDVAVCGASRDDDGAVDAGAAYVFDVTDDAIAPYCNAKRNSLGCLPSIGSTGAPSLTGPDDFHITADGIVAGRLGVLVWSLQARPSGPPGPFAPLAMSPVGARLCLSGPVVAASLDSGGAPGTCDGTFDVLFSQAIMVGASLPPGSTIHAQYVYRDPGHPDGSGVGHTEALRFCIRD